MKKNVVWIAPTAAILVVGVALADRQSAFSFSSASEETAPVVPASAASNVDQINASVLAALAAKNAAAEAAPQPTAPAPEVTRNAPLNLLDNSAPDQPVATAVAAAPQPAFDASNAAAFFNSAQSRLAVDNACGEDLAALAAQARVYFPTGAASGDEAGMNAARLIGQVAQECPGFSIQVEGHSDASGDPRTNQRLSEQRAQSVINRLSAAGIDTSGFFAVGFGDTQPSGLRGPESAAYYDRRVEFSVVRSEQRASFSTGAQPWATAPSASTCVSDLERRATQLRQFYAPGAITVQTTELQALFTLADEVVRCDGARLRLVGQHEDEAGSREGPSTGRLRALAMMSMLTSAGYPGERILIGAPSWSVDVPGQPGLPNSRIDIQVISD